MSWLRMMTMGLLAAPLALSGCWMQKSDSRAKLGADAFYTPVPGAEERRTPGEASGAIVGAESASAPRVATAQRPKTPTPTTIPPAVRAVIPAPGIAAAPQAAPMPTTRAPGATQQTGAGVGPGTSAQYMTLGAVVTTVSGTPIYADKVLQAITPLLSSEAKHRDFASYRAMAKIEIDKQVQAMVRNELLYAAANKYLGAEDKDYAWRLTNNWQQRQATEAGGSMEMARAKSAAEGIDFNEKVKEQNRYFLVQIYFAKKIYPKIQVTADEMRQYYDRHLKSDFTEVDQAQFRLIKITAKNTGSREAAIEKIKSLHDELMNSSDADFAKRASQTNDDSLLMKNGGHVGAGDGWVQRGAYAIQEIEDAVWKLQPGQVTDVISIGDSFYIARLEARKLGRVVSFEDPNVQAQIEDELKKPQLSARRLQLENQLIQFAAIDPDPPVTDAVMEMALQKYSTWAAAK